jgi:hypothetical protein
MCQRASESMDRLSFQRRENLYDVRLHFSMVLPTRNLETNFSQIGKESICIHFSAPIVNPLMMYLEKKQYTMITGKIEIAMATYIAP